MTPGQLNTGVTSLTLYNVFDAQGELLGQQVNSHFILLIVKNIGGSSTPARRKQEPLSGQFNFNFSEVIVMTRAYVIFSHLTTTNQLCLFSRRRRKSTMGPDSESLFGSPPPSPSRGRSPSPALALPSASVSVNLGSSTAQNVGTIALPGSHHISELPVNPLALSLSHPSPDAPRPPAQRSGFVAQVRPQTFATPTSLASPILHKAKPPRKNKAKPKLSTHNHAARPSPPPIHLPDPSDPFPPNLLRNQPGLLGTAGVVAGVQASKLPSRFSQGTTSCNPIVVDDRPERRPAASRVKRPPRVISRIDVDINSLPPPSNRDIVNILLKHQDTIPLLQNILKLIANEVPQPPADSYRGQSVTSSDTGSRAQTPSEASSASTTTRKRRKLRHVPAGADLWDVPFPFNEGEGPETYRSNWEKNRGKKLIAELVNLIKSAARKAAVVNYAEKRNPPTDAELAAMGKHYRVDTLFYGKESVTSEVFTDASNARCSLESSPSPSTASESSVPPSNLSTPSDPKFDGLISSLLSASSNEQLSFPGGVDSFDGFCASPALDPGLYDSWMDIFQTFPADGFTSDFKVEDRLVDYSLTVPDPLPSFDFPPPEVPPPPEAPPSFALTETAGFTLSPYDLAIDPVLLGLSTPSALPGSIDTSDLSGGTSNFLDSGCHSLGPSPVPSVSSHSFGPMTPTDGGWNGDTNTGVYASRDDLRPSILPPTNRQAQGKKRDFSTMTQAEQEALSFMEVVSKSKLDADKAKSAGKGKGKGKGKASEEDEDVVDEAHVEEVHEDFSKLKTVSIVGRLAKDDVLKRAKQKREELVTEIEKTRIALWETTIEGGVLASLVKVL